MFIWFKDKLTDFKFWWKYEHPFRNCWRGFKDRVDAVIFCIMLLIVGIYSPKTLRRIMIDALNEKKVR